MNRRRQSCGPRRPHGVRRAPHRHDAGRPGRDAGRAGLCVPRGTDRRRRAADHSRTHADGAAGRRARGGRPCEAENACRRQPRAEILHRTRLLRHAHAGRHPAQHPRESGVVHRVYAVSARNCARAPRSAGQFPDDGVRPDRHGDRERVDAGRGDRGGGSDGAGAARRQEREPALLRRDDVFAQTLDVVRTRAQPLGARSGRRTGGAGSRGGRARRRIRRVAAVSGCGRRRARLPRARRGAPRAGRTGHRRGRYPRVDAARAPRRMGRRHGGRFDAAVRRADGLRRSACGIPRDARRIQARAAGPAGRRHGRRARQRRVPARAADARTAYSPREGDLEHLHGAGAARRHREHVRRVPRTGRD